MKKTYISSILFLLILLSACDKIQESNKNSLLVGEWIRSCEESDHNYNIFHHPNDEKYDACYGSIEKYTFFEDGRVHFHFQSTACILFEETLEGLWDYDDNTISLDFNNDRSYTFEVIILDMKDLIVDIKY